MGNMASYISSQAPYYGYSTVLVKNHRLNDIIDYLIQYHHEKDHKAYYDSFSDKFWAGTPRATAKRIFDYLMKNVKYHEESPEDQSIKSPGAIVHMAYGDCKHYASFANGVLSSLQRKGYPIQGDVLYRFTGYNPMSDDVHHVFSVIKNGSNEIWIDPVVKQFDYHKPFEVKIDQKVSSMPLKYIAGVGYTDGMGNIFDDIKKGAQNTWNAVSTGTRNTATAVSQGAQNTIDKTKQPVMKISVSLARNSFLLLVKVNAFNLAHRLYDFMKKSPQQQKELENKWKELGGDFNNLVNNINEGMQGYWKRNNTTGQAYNASKGFVSGINTDPGMQMYYQFYGSVFPYYIAGFSDGVRVHSRQIGVEPASAAALLTAAAAIIAALAPILKRAGWSNEDQKNASNIAAAGASALSNAGNGAAPGANVTLPSGGSASLLETTVNATADGTKVVTVKDTGTIEKATGAGSFTETVKQGLDSIKTFAIENKYPLGALALGVAAWKMGLFSAISASPTKKGRK